MTEFDPPLDPGIRQAVELLSSQGVETFESCQGGSGHAYPEPTVRFHGERAEGMRALSVALSHGLPVLALRRIWTVIEGEPTGPYWEIVFRAATSDGQYAAAKIDEQCRCGDWLSGHAAGIWCAYCSCEAFKPVTAPAP